MQNVLPVLWILLIVYHVQQIGLEHLHVLAIVDITKIRVYNVLSACTHVPPARMARSV